MVDEREFKILITGDAAGIMAASKQGADALGETAKATEKTSESSQVLFGHTEKLHKLFHQMDHTLPGLGVALKAVFSPEGLGIAAGMAAFHILREVIESSSEEAKRAAEERKQAMAEEMVYWKDLFDSVDKYTHALFGGNVVLDEMKNSAKELSAHIGRVTEGLKFLAGMRGEDKGAIEVEGKRATLVAAEQEWKRAKDAAEASGLEAQNEENERRERIENNTRLVEGLKRTGRGPEALLLERQVEADKRAIEDARTRHVEAQRYADEVERTLPGLAESFNQSRDTLGLKQNLVGEPVVQGASAERALIGAHGNVNALNRDQAESLKALNNLLGMVYGNNRDLWNQALGTLAKHADDINFLKQFAQRLNAQVTGTVRQMQ